MLQSAKSRPAIKKITKPIKCTVTKNYTWCRKMFISPFFKTKHLELSNLIFFRENKMDINKHGIPENCTVIRQMCFRSVEMYLSRSLPLLFFFQRQGSSKFQTVFVPHLPPQPAAAAFHYFFFRILIRNFNNWGRKQKHFSRLKYQS